MEVGAQREHATHAPELLRSQVLDVGAFLQARVVLLNLVAELLVIKEEGEIRPQFEERAREEGVELEHVAGLTLAAEVGAERAVADATAVIGIDEAEAVEATGGHLFDRNLTRREEVVPARAELEAEGAAPPEREGVAGRHVVAQAWTTLKAGSMSSASWRCLAARRRSPSA